MSTETSTRIRSEFNGSLQRFYDVTTQETTFVNAPMWYVDDFVGTATLLDGTTEWSVVDESAAGDTTPARGADGENGTVIITMDANDEAEDSAIYHGDQRSFNVKDGGIFETRVQLTATPGTGVCCVFGVAGDHNLDKDSVTEHLWFRLDASAVLKVETDDTTNNNDDVATGITMDNTSWYICRIDTTDNTDCKFYVDGVRVGSGTTFDISNLSDAEGIMQPYFSLDKAGGLNAEGTLTIDYIKWAGYRQ